MLGQVVNLPPVGLCGLVEVRHVAVLLKVDSLPTLIRVRGDAVFKSEGLEPLTFDGQPTVAWVLVENGANLHDYSSEGDGRLLDGDLESQGLDLGEGGAGQRLGASQGGEGLGLLTDGIDRLIPVDLPNGDGDIHGGSPHSDALAIAARAFGRMLPRCGNPSFSQIATREPRASSRSGAAAIRRALAGP